MRLNASVSIPADIVKDFSLNELERHFRKHEVIFRGLNFSIKEPATKVAVFSLNGSKENLRMSIRNLYTLSTQVKSGMENKPARSVPDDIRAKLEILKDKDSYDKLYNFCADEYMKHCALNDQMPHPEVSENFVY